jgi:hypothetical protein
VSTPAPPTRYDVGYADGRRDAANRRAGDLAVPMVDGAEQDRYADGYREGFLDRQADEQQVEFLLLHRVGTWIGSRFHRPVGTQETI